MPGRPLSEIRRMNEEVANGNEIETDDENPAADVSVNDTTNLI